VGSTFNTLLLANGSGANETNAATATHAIPLLNLMEYWGGITSVASNFNVGLNTVIANGDSILTLAVPPAYLLASAVQGVNGMVWCNVLEF
jgi:hypothetical protein